MFFRTKRGELRVSPPWYKFLLATHIVVSVGWLGVAAAKLVLGVRAITTADPDLPDALYTSMQAMNALFPPAAVATLLTGVALSLGTKWSLLHYYWVLAKLGLTVGVITTGILFVDRLIRQSITSAPGQEVGVLPEISSVPMVLISLSVVHALMLSAAVVISLYKPWGKTRFGRDPAGRPSQREGRNTAKTWP